MFNYILATCNLSATKNYITNFFNFHCKTKAKKKYCNILMQKSDLKMTSKHILVVRSNMPVSTKETSGC